MAATTTSNGVPTGKFSTTEPPTPEQIKKATKMIVFDGKGQPQVFGDLIRAGPEEKVIVIFVRHMFCGLCQEYVTYLNETITPEKLQESKVRLLIVGHGAASFIRGYSTVTDNKFPMYTQPSKELYAALGMTLRNLDSAGSKMKRPSYSSKSTGNSIWAGVKNAFRMGPLFARFGDIKQQGGEFVFGPDYKILYTHRMEHARDHADIEKVLAAAGVTELPPPNANKQQSKVTVAPVEDGPGPSTQREPAAGAVSSAAVAGGPLPASAAPSTGAATVTPPTEAPAAVAIEKPAAPAAAAAPSNEPVVAAGSVSQAAVSGGPLAASAAPGAGSNTIAPPNSGLAPPLVAPNPSSTGAAA